MKFLYLDRPNGTRIHLYPQAVTGIVPDPHTSYDWIIYQGANHAADIHITHTEASQFIGMMAWKPHNCRMPAGTCYGRREAEQVPAGCVGCMLRKSLYDAGECDLRALLRTADHPLKVPLCVAATMWAFMWVWGQSTRENWRIIERDRDYWQARAVRAEEQYRLTFKKQTAKGVER